MAYHCINGFLLMLIYCLTKIQQLKWFYCFGKYAKWPFSRIYLGFWYVWSEVLIFLCLYCQRFHIASHYGIEECPNQLWRNVGLSWPVFLGFHTIGTIFLLRPKDHDRKPESFPFQHTWIWNSLFNFFGVTFIFSLCFSSLTLVCDI